MALSIAMSIAYFAIILAIGICASDAPNVAAAAAMAAAIWMAHVTSWAITAILSASTTPAITISPAPMIWAPVAASLSRSAGLSADSHAAWNAATVSAVLP